MFAATLVIPAVLVGYWILRRPQRGILLLAALAPFDGLLLLVSHPEFVEGWSEALVVVVVGAAMLCRPPAATGSWPRTIPTWTVAMAALFALAVGSVALELTSQSLLGLRLGYFHLLIPIALWRHPLLAADRDHLVSILMAGGLITSLVGIAQQIAGHEALNRLGYEYNSVIRTTGGHLRSFSTFNQPFPFALYVMVALLVCLPVALTDMTRRRNRWFVYLSPVLVLGLTTAIVRGALLGLAIGGLFLAIHRHRRLAHVIAPIMITALLVPASVSAAVFSPSSLDTRTTGWAEMVDQITTNPLGGGVGSVGAAAQKARSEAVTDSFPSAVPVDAYQPDNYYIKVLIELGPVGLWLFVAAVLGCWFHGRRVSRTRPGIDGALASGITAATVAAAAAGLVSSYWEIFPVDLYFWLLVGVLTSIEFDSRSTHSPSAPAAAGSRPTSGTSLVPSGR